MDSREAYKSNFTGSFSERKMARVPGENASAFFRRTGTLVDGNRAKYKTKDTPPKMQAIMKKTRERRRRPPRRTEERVKVDPR